MEIYTRDRNFFKQDVIDEFNSAIWTERYKGDGDFQISVPAGSAMDALLPRGQILMCEGSDIPMILETRETKDGILKTTGIDLPKWLNNRIIRTTNDHSVKEYTISGDRPAQAMAWIVTNFAMEGSPYLNGTIDIGIPTFQVSLMPIPGLQIGATDLSDPVTDFSVPFGPVYDALKQIADSYDIGMRIEFQGAYDDYYILQYITYKGVDRTSGQTVNPVIQFSPDMETFTDITDLESMTDYRNWVYTFAPQAQSLGPTAGWAASYAPPGMGFDLRVAQVFADDITSDTVGADLTKLNNVLQQKANVGLNERKLAKLVDGEIVQTGQIVYGRDYFLGDLVEVEGNSGVINTARISEYIRSQDASGERAYPTLEMID